MTITSVESNQVKPKQEDIRKREEAKKKAEARKRAEAKKKAEAKKQEELAQKKKEEEARKLALQEVNLIAQVSGKVEEEYEDEEVVSQIEVTAAAESVNKSTPISNGDFASRLAVLKTAYEADLLTEQEFLRKKKELLDQL